VSSRLIHPNHTPLPNAPIRDGEWLDAAGTRWRLRGERWQTPAKRVEHLLRSPEVRVLLFYGPDAPTGVGPADRDALWQRMRPYLREPVVRAPGTSRTSTPGSSRTTSDAR
jgi:hypothetical protein